ncbi:hypothetical protein AOLI_G00303360 [Acnodon oligacanthus]
MHFTFVFVALLNSDVKCELTLNRCIKSSLGVPRKKNDPHADIHSPARGMFFILTSKTSLQHYSTKAVCVCVLRP